MILLWGIPTDGPLEMVRAALLRMGAPVIFLDQQAVLRSGIRLTSNGRVCGRLKTPDWSVDLASVSAVYLRPYDPRRMPALEDLTPSGETFRRALEFEDALSCWVEMTSALVVNRPSAMASNNSKPYQLQLIRDAGFDVPETLVTTDPAAATEFQERHSAVIYKSISGIRSMVTRLGPEHRERLSNIAHCPTQFQQYIEGTDFRIHVVADQVFACAIRSDADDYRYPQAHSAGPQVRSCEVPRDIDDRCLKLAAVLDLAVAGIDLRRTPSGRWYCFEANPSPGFSFYEEATGQAIGEAVARLLMRNMPQNQRQDQNHKA